MLYTAVPNGAGQVGIQFINVPAGSPAAVEISLSYVPSALAADSTRERLYIANALTNQIQVYSTTTFGLIATIQ
jgi:DNA-binding beta-propeller fold protein YncE